MNLFRIVHMCLFASEELTLSTGYGTYTMDLKFHTFSHRLQFSLLRISTIKKAKHPHMILQCNKIWNYAKKIFNKN